MRIRQVQSLVWIGDAVVLAAAAWAGAGFVRSLEARLVRGVPAWPEVAGTPPVSGRSDDGTALDGWIRTPVDGPVPKPPEDDEPPPTASPDVEFRRKVRITGGFVGSSETTSVRMTFGARPATLRLGESIDALGRSWQLVAFVRGEAGGAATAHFHAPDFDVPVTQEPPALGPLTGPALVKFVPTFEEGGPIDPERVRADWIGRRAFRRPRTDEWTVTLEEFLWWETFGEAEFLSKLATETATDARGNPRGVRLLKVPSPPALVTDRGFFAGDVVVSVNEVPVRERKDVTATLRGEARRVDRYEVVVERDGVPRTLVYTIEGRGAVSGRH